MFAYCGNNPINWHDSNGMIWEKIGGFLKEIGTAIASFAGAFFGAESLSFITTAKAEDRLPKYVKTPSFDSVLNACFKKAKMENDYI